MEDIYPGGGVCHPRRQDGQRMRKRQKNDQEEKEMSVEVSARGFCYRQSVYSGEDSVLGKPGSRLSKNYRDKKRSPQIFKSVAVNLWCGETHLAINRIYIPFTF